MKRLIPLTLVSTMVLIGVALTPLLTAEPVDAIKVLEKACEGSSGAICGSSDEQAPDIIKTVIDAALVILGMIAVVMIVIGGVRYTTSNGDANGIKGAKDTILYAIVGLIVAILAYAIVNFVLGRFSGN